MSKRVCATIVLVLGLVLLSANMGTAQMETAEMETAQQCSNLVGTWSGKSAWVSWDSGSYQYDSSSTETLVVTYQSSCLFYGTVFDGQPIVGNITGKKITATTSAWGGVLILNGGLTGNTIKGTYNYGAQGKGSFSVEAGNFEFTK